MKTLILGISVFLMTAFNSQDSVNLSGGWHITTEDGLTGQWIMAEKHFAVTFYKGNEFKYTYGGSWNLTDNNQIQLHYEFHTDNKDKVGQTEKLEYALKGKKLEIGGLTWKRTDNNKPGDLADAWVITGRERNGEMNTMTPGARKTMKILSGTYFQWIAYNSETGDFRGTGGGNYTTNDGQYTEIIKFFSRDSNRVGAELVFNYELKDGEWHHRGKSSKGDPIYEIWSDRVDLGI
ncbi:membrane or secreted protein [Marivirga harenae]|uniref:membrane or secreted protein n=1 Tax=Marivirga harenae TaxID=2010992 RepID=UPI0026DFD990|nr:membrane or secreted protein [Marivirga harenae]WKV12943.1 membrane or secreted protein [Marivirga harenae]